MVSTWVLGCMFACVGDEACHNTDGGQGGRGTITLTLLLLKFQDSWVNTMTVTADELAPCVASTSCMCEILHWKKHNKNTKRSSKWKLKKIIAHVDNIAAQHDAELHSNIVASCYCCTISYLKLLEKLTSYSTSLFPTNLMLMEIVVKLSWLLLLWLSFDHDSDYDRDNWTVISHHIFGVNVIFSQVLSWNIYHLLWRNWSNTIVVGDILVFI